jgi:hypothetical protein
MYLGPATIVATQRAQAVSKARRSAVIDSRDSRRGRLCVVTFGIYNTKGVTTMEKTSSPTVPVSTRALIARLNRKLRQDGEVLKTARGERMCQQVGAFYVIDVSLNAVVGHDVDIERYGRDYGCFAPHEYHAE